MTISKRLAGMLRERGLLQKDLATHCGISASTVSSWMHINASSIPSEHILPICQLLHITPEELLTGVPREEYDLGWLRVSDEEKRLVDIFRKLDWEGKQVVAAAVITEARRVEGGGAGGSESVQASPV